MLNILINDGMKIKLMILQYILLAISCLSLNFQKVVTTVMLVIIRSRQKISSRALVKGLKGTRQFKSLLYSQQQHKASATA